MSFEAALENLYQVFSSYKARPNSMPYCDHCRSLDEAMAVFKRPLRQATTDDLHHYAWDAMTTWGEEYDFKHFLPRIFELLVADPEFKLHTDPVIVTSKLAYGHWENWSAEEREAVITFLIEAWKKVIARGDVFEIIEWIPAILRPGLPFDGFAEAWLADKSLTATKVLAETVVEYECNIGAGYIMDAFLEEADVRAESERTAQWFKSETVKQKLRAALAQLNEQLMTKALEIIS